MRSSKSRSRSKSNRPRSIGNIINRVFDSSGPDGKVRGTPQQLIEKYQFLARDAQLSNDRVAAENFQQHAEHYTRMLGEAQRELAADQDSRRQPGDGGQNSGQNSGQNGGQNGGPYVAQGNTPNGGQSRDQNGQQNGNPNGNQSRDQNGNPNRDRPYRDDRPQRDDRPDTRDAMIDTQPQRLVPILGFADETDDNGLVETPESRPRPAPAPRAEFRDRPPRAEQPDRAPRAEQPDRAPRAEQPERREDRKPRSAPRPVVSEPEAPVADRSDATAAEPATADAPPAPRRARAPRKPRADAAAEPTKGPAEAAE